MLLLWDQLQALLVLEGERGALGAPTATERVICT